jgi:Flp pilus assembly protein TadG
MRNNFSVKAAKLQRGAAAVEAAIVIALVLLPVLGCTLYLGRFMWYYTVAQKAVHDASLYMAGAPLNEIKGIAAATLAASIITEETADLDTSTETYPTANCGYKLSPNSTNINFVNCNPTKVPVAVQAAIAMTVTDPFLSGITTPILGGTGLTIFVDSTMTYVGR